MGSSRRQPQSGFSPQRGLRPTLPVQTLSDKRTDNNKLLCRSSQEQLPVGGIASAVKQKCCRTSSKSTIPGVLQPVVPCTKTQQPVAPYLGSKQIKQFSKNPNFQDGDPRDDTDLSPGRRVGDLHRLQRRVLPCPHKQSVQEVHAFSHPRQDLSIQSTTLWSVHSHETGYKDPPVPRRLVGQGQVPPGLLSTDTEPGDTLQGPGMVSEPGKVRAGTETNFQFRRLPVRPERWQGLQVKIREILASPVCPVRNFMSLIGLLTATEKQVHMGRLHMRPIQWHLKNNWRMPETLEKTIPIPKSLHPHLK